VSDVTVVVPTHDRGGLLASTLRSVLAQRGVDLDVVVVDDGSTDGTRDLVAGIADDRLRLVRHDEPRRVSEARNSGVRAATGSWVAFCDDDDVWAPDKLAEQLAAARRLGRDWAYAGVVTVDDALRPVAAPPTPTPEQVVRELPRYNAVPGGGSNVLVRRELLDRAGPFDPGLRNTEDWEMWLRLSRLGPPAVAGRRLVGYRVHAANASLDVGEILAGVARIERRHQTRVDRGRIHRWLAESCLRQGRRGQAVRHWATAARAGAAAAVAADVAVLLRRRLGGPGGAGVPDWVREARAWLDPLAAADPGAPVVTRSQ
jgi:glycosyltransferase involved in cell wall biosynthesis